MRHQQAEPPDLEKLRPAVPDGLVPIVQRMLAKRPADRYQTPAEVAAALGRLSGPSRSAPARWRGANSPDPRPAKLHRVALGAAVAVLILGIALGVFAWSSRSDPQTAGRISALTAPAPSGKAMLTPPNKSTEPEKHSINSIGMKLALLPAGQFLMGSTPDEIERLKKEPHRYEPERWDQLEGPQHEVRISKPFSMGAHEVTVGHFRRFVDANGYKTQAEREGGAYRHFPDGSWKQDPACNWRNPGLDQIDDHPVVCVSWNDAKEFCDWLTKKENGERGASAPRVTWRFLTRVRYKGDSQKAQWWWTWWRMSNA